MFLINSARSSYICLLLFVTNILAIHTLTLWPLLVWGSVWLFGLVPAIGKLWCESPTVNQVQEFSWWAGLQHCIATATRRGNKRGTIYRSAGVKRGLLTKQKVETRKGRDHEGGGGAKQNRKNIN